MRKKLFSWFFKKEIADLKSDLKQLEQIRKSYLATESCILEYKRVLEDVLDRVEVSVDVDTSKYSQSWAVVSIQGGKSDFIRFMDLGKTEALHIQRFLAQYGERVRGKVDFPTGFPKEFLKIKR